MTAWVEQIRPASFRGVGFQVDTHAVSAQVRGDVYELEDTTKGQVLGLGARRHRIEGFIHGEGSVARSLALRAALEIGEGVLVHPLYGELTVQIGQFSVESDPTRHERFSVSFEAIKIDPAPYVPLPDPDSLLEAAIAAARRSVLDDFLGAFAVAGDLADSVLDEAEAIVNRGLDGVAAALSAVADARAAVARIAEIKADVRALLLAPQKFADAVLALFADIADLFALQRSVSPEVPVLDSYPTASDAQADTNAVAVRQLLAIGALVRGAELFPGWSFSSSTAAIASAGDLASAMQSEEEIATPDIAAALADVRVALGVAAASVAGDLVPIESVTLDEPESAVLLAHRLHGDPDRADDIVARNDAADPGALLGAVNVAAA